MTEREGGAKGAAVLKIVTAKELAVSDVRRVNLSVSDAVERVGAEEDDLMVVVVDEATEADARAAMIEETIRRRMTEIMLSPAERRVAGVAARGPWSVMSTISEELEADKEVRVLSDDVTREMCANVEESEVDGADVEEVRWRRTSASRSTGDRGRRATGKVADASNTPLARSLKQTKPEHTRTRERRSGSLVRRRSSLRVTIVGSRSGDLRWRLRWF